MRISVYQKEKIERAIYWCRKAFQIEYKKQISNAFGVLSSLYHLHSVAGFLFDLDQSNICRDIQKIEPLIRNCLPIPQRYTA